MTTTATITASDRDHQEVIGRESGHVMCQEKMDTSDDNQTVEREQSPVTVTKFESFYLSLRHVEKERRNQCTDSVRRLRLRRYRVENTPRQSITPTPRLEEIEDEDDEEIFHIGDFELECEPSHEVVQHAYGAGKEVWEWGKTVPVLSDVLGLTEGVTTKFLQLTIHIDDVEKDLVIPNLKRLDDEIVSPSIGAILNIIGPAVDVGDEVIVKPALHMAPHIPFVGQLLFGEKKKRDEEKESTAGEIDDSSLSS